MERQRTHLLCALGDKPALHEAIRSEFGQTHQIHLLAEGEIAAAAQALLARAVGLDVLLISRRALEGQAMTLELLRQRHPEARLIAVGDGADQGDAPPEPGQPWLAVPDEMATAELCGVIRAAIHSARRDRWDDLGRALGESVLLGRLPQRDLRWLAHRVEVRSYEAGEDVVREGDTADGLYVIRWGEVQILIGREGGRIEVARLGRNSHFGDIALLTGQPRTATVRTILDTEVLFVWKRDFHAVLARHPPLASHLNQVLIDTLHRSERGPSLRRLARTLCSLSTLEDAEGVELSHRLARAIAEETRGRTLVVDMAGGRAPCATAAAIVAWLDSGTPASTSPLVDRGAHLWTLSVERGALSEDLLAPRLGRLLEPLRAGFDNVIIALGAGHSAGLVSATLRQSDRCVLTTARTRASAHRGRSILSSLCAELPDADQRLRLVLDNAVPAEGSCDHRWLAATLGREVDIRLRSDAPRSLHSAARRLTDLAVGLALSGGGARGLAHIGVVDVLQEERIPIDLVAGTSMGASVGALLSAGRSAREILGIMREICVHRKPFPLSEYRLPLTALSSGQGTAALMSHYLRGSAFEDLPTEFMAIACDLLSGEEVTLRHGDVGAAVRASCSIPGVLPPVALGSWRLVDGGIVNNLPAEPLRRRGAALVIGADVFADPPSLPVQAGGALRRLLGQSDSLRELMAAPTLLQVLMQSFYIAAREIGRRGAWQSDLCIRPSVADFSPLDFSQLDALVERGRVAVRACLPQIREKLRSLQEGRS